MLVKRTASWVRLLPAQIHRRLSTISLKSPAAVIHLEVSGSHPWQRLPHLLDHQPSPGLPLHFHLRLGHRMGKMPFHRIFPSHSPLTAHHLLHRWESRLIRLLSRAVPRLQMRLLFPKEHLSRGITLTDTPPWAAELTRTLLHRSCNRVPRLLTRHPPCRPFRCIRHLQGHWHRYRNHASCPGTRTKIKSLFSLNCLFYLLKIVFFWHKMSSTFSERKIFSQELVWNCCFRKISLSVKWECSEAVAMLASGIRNKARLWSCVALFCLLLSLLPCQPTCCIVCASAVNQVIYKLRR